MRIVSWLGIGAVLTVGPFSVGCRKSAPTGGGAANGSVAVAPDAPVIPAAHTLSPSFVRSPTATSAGNVVPVKRVALSRDGSRLLAVARDGVKGAQVWNLGAKPAKLGEWETYTDHAALSDDGRRVVVSPALQPTVFDVDSGKRLYAAQSGGARMRFCEPDLLLAVQDDYSKPGNTAVRLEGFDAASGEPRFTQPVSNTGQAQNPPILFFDGGRQFVFLRDKSDAVELWESREHKLSRQVTVKAAGGEPGGFNSVVSASGNLLAAEKKSTVVIWNLGSGDVVAEVPKRDLPLVRSMFLPGRDVVVFVGMNKSDAGTFDIKAFDVASRTIIAIFRGGQGAVDALDASADGKWLASGHADGTVRVWDLSQLP